MGSFEWRRLKASCKGFKRPGLLPSEKAMDLLLLAILFSPALPAQARQLLRVLLLEYCSASSSNPQTSLLRPPPLIFKPHTLARLQPRSMKCLVNQKEHASSLTKHTISLHRWGSSEKKPVIPS